jgi:hypothetical protein
VVEVRARPPSSQTKAPRSIIARTSGTSVVSPGPHTKRGRSTIVSKPAAFAATTRRSASALVSA